MDPGVGDLVERGRQALRQGDAATARDAFERVMTADPSGHASEGLARAHYLSLDFTTAIAEWERAYAMHRAAGEAVRAVRVARRLAYMYGAVLGDFAVMNGWNARAESLLGDSADSSEAGWIALNRGMFEGDRERKETFLLEALAVARRLGDSDLEFDALAYLGASLVHGDRTEEGMVLLDEALAAIAGREVDDQFVIEEIFCQLFSACEHACDVARADQWIRVGEAIARRRNLPSVSAFCHTHYGGVLTAAGRWKEADQALTEAVRLWALGFRPLRAGALIRLADLRVRQGRYEEAAQLLEGLETTAEAARPMAVIHLARGHTALARDVLERGLEQVEPTGAASAQLLSLLVDTLLAAGDLDAARAAADRLEERARRRENPYLSATAALARGRICLVTASGDPQACLREALAGFTQAQMPMELAQTRMALAGALRTERPEVALAEARAALDAFDKLQAAREADAAAALLRALGARTAPSRPTAGPLTKREDEVLALIREGLSNPEIADRLFISRKTVEHHVGNILAKLGLKNRAEAVAYAVRQKPARE